MSCTNPCGDVPVNSAQSETLPSQIENFTKQFFGTVIKTEVDGVVSWSLPCGLDVGLPANPRGVDEGLACYFLRLFDEGIVGLTGPQGPAGSAGTNGNNAYTVTLASFVQPTLASPTVQVTTQYNPSLRDGMYIFIDTSGWFLIEGSDGTGVLFLRLVKELPTPYVGTVIAGKVVTPSGYPGATVVGPAGPTGPQGPAGAAGDTTTGTNGSYTVVGGTDYTATLSFATVNFTASSAQVLLPTPGKYLVIATVTLHAAATVVSGDVAYAKLYNTSNSGDVAGTSLEANTFSTDQKQRMTLVGIATTDAANQTVALQVRGSVENTFHVQANNTSIVYVRLQ